MSNLTTSHPQLLEEWDYALNNEQDVLPENFSFGSGKKVFWKCKNGHSWEMSINSRTLRQYNCPKCKNLKNGSLADNKPALLKIWDFEKNTLDPHQVSKSSSIPVFWKCKNNHEWEQSIALVAVKEIPCKICSKVKNGSLLSLFPKVAQGLDITRHPEIDANWIAPSSNQRLHWVCANGHTWEAPVNRVTRNNLGCPDCPRTGERKSHPTISNSNFARFWDIDKNSELNFNPEKIRLGSGSKAYWKCDEGHSWFMRISLFAEKGKCVECNIGSKSDAGYTKHPKLSVGYPLIASEWHPTRNNPLTANNVSGGSGKSVWWQCKNGHEWENSISNRTINQQNCKICKNITSGSVASSEKISEWDFDKNKNTNPNDISINNSRIKYWWKCIEGHSWKSSASTRIISDHNCPECHFLKNGSLEDNFPEIAKQWSNQNKNKSNEVSYGSKKKAVWQCDEGHVWSSAIDNRTGKNKSGCPHCNPPFSKKEKELVRFLKDNGVQLEENKRDLIPGTKLELDIYIPEKKIAIEFNGVYWHSEKFGKDKHYHKNKVDLCEANGIRLIQVWEDDWDKNSEIVKNGIAHRLGFSKVEKVPARKTNADVISGDVAKSFLDTYHIQGFSSGTVYMGLFDNREYSLEEPIAVIAFTIRGDKAYLERYATSKNISGGFSKLINFAEPILNVKGVETLITFADKSLSQGDLYEQTGWIADSVLDPDYSYLVDGERKHKFGYRLKRFKNDPNLKYDPTMTEKQLAELNNIPRVWDSGKIRYIKYV